MSRRRIKLPLRPRPIDPLHKQAVYDDDFEPLIPGRDPLLPIDALADNDGNVIVDDSNRTSVRVGD